VLECGAEEIPVCNVASSYRMDVKEGYSTGERVKLFCDMIERFIDEDKLTVSCTDSQGRTANDFDITSNSQYINKRYNNESYEFRNATGKFQNPYSYLIQKCVVLFNPLEQYS
jgi:hypothetical protein